MSAGDISIRIELFGIGNLEAIIIRHIAPLVADAILDKMPFIMRGRFNFGAKKTYWTIPEVGIRKGLEATKASNIVNKGDMIYNQKTDELIIILEDLEMPNKVNKVGKIETNIDIVFNARNGLNTKFLKVK